MFVTPPMSWVLPGMFPVWLRRLLEGRGLPWGYGHTLHAHTCVTCCLCAVLHLLHGR